MIRPFNNHGFLNEAPQAKASGFKKRNTQAAHNSIRTLKGAVLWLRTYKFKKAYILVGITFFLSILFTFIFFKAAQSAPEQKLGIQIESIRFSAGGFMIDFRYRVIDPDKALAVLNPKVHPYILDEASGAKFSVPAPPKIGSLRNTVRLGKPRTDRVYYVLFANPGRYIKKGQKVSVMWGDIGIKGLKVY